MSRAAHFDGVALLLLRDLSKSLSVEKLHSFSTRTNLRDLPTPAHLIVVVHQPQNQEAIELQLLVLDLLLLAMGTEPTLLGVNVCTTLK